MSSQLNPQQQEAVLHRDGPAVVFAGAGSGKTRIITQRIARLLETGVRPWEILALTFTNKAAREMKERALQLHPETDRCLISTFHSACARWLREFCHVLNLVPHFSIYDDSDSQGLLKKVLVTVFSDPTQTANVARYKAALEQAKMHGILWEDWSDFAKQTKKQYPPAFKEVYEQYEKALSACQAVDFGNLILHILRILRHHTEIRNILTSRFAFVLVDEFQDTNPAQWELLSHLVAPHKNLFVVGDDDQSIYSWRGATPSNLLEFEQFYQGAVHIKLSENYRSAKNIIDASQALIRNNKYRVDKNLYSTKKSFCPIVYRYERDDQSEAWWIASTIQQELKRYTYADFAIFYRTNAQSRTLEETFQQEGIPYKIYGSLRFYDRMEIKDILAYIKVLINPHDAMSLKRIINVPTRGIGAKTVSGLEAQAMATQTSLYDALQKEGPKKAKLLDALLIFERLKTKLKEADDPSLIVDWVLKETAYDQYLRQKFPEQYDEKMENVQELKGSIYNWVENYAENTGAGGFNLLSDWIQSLSLASDQNDAQQEHEGGFVTLMTLHLAKGLEFRRVFVAGVEEELLPHKNCQLSAEIEEERRLLYVGMTRAMETLSLSSVHYRFSRGGNPYRTPSRFLNEIPEHFLKIERATAGQDYSPSVSNHYLDAISDETTAYQPIEEDAFSENILGSKVIHYTYGEGQVVRLKKGVKGQVLALVDFKEFGEIQVKQDHLEWR